MPITEVLQSTSPIARFTEDVVSVPWGSMARGELDFLVFRLLIDGGQYDLAASDFALANALLTTPARVRALRFRYEQRRSKEEPGRLNE